MVSVVWRYLSCASVRRTDSMTIYANMPVDRQQSNCDHHGCLLSVTTVLAWYMMIIDEASS